MGFFDKIKDVTYVNGQLCCWLRQSVHVEYMGRVENLPPPPVYLLSDCRPMLLIIVSYIIGGRL